MDGALPEGVLERALVLHDKLVTALEQERSSAEARAAAGVQAQGHGDLIDFGGGEDSKPPAAPQEAVKPIPTHPAQARVSTARNRSATA